MRSDAQIILAFDTSGPHLSAALFKGGLIASRQVEMAKGQAENLTPFLQGLLDSNGITYQQLDLIAVGIGPGNFTGIRMSVSLARGLAMSLEIPSVGVSMFEASLSQDDPLAEPTQIISVAAPRNQAYVQRFQNGRPQSAPLLIDPDNPPRDLNSTSNMVVTGFCAHQIAQHFGARHQDADLSAIAANIARFAEIKKSNNWDLDRAPSPLYARPPDAAPARNPAPTILPA